jgi:histidine triad (HIT) family protein
MSYDDNNIFAKILRGEIPCNKIYEDDFTLKASSEEMVGLLKGINIVAKKLGISTEVGKGYRALANISDHGGQEVPHLHFHLFGGEKVGKMVE